MLTEVSACDKYLAFADDGAGKTEQLPLTDREILPVLVHNRVQAVIELRDLTGGGGGLSKSWVLHTLTDLLMQTSCLLL